MRASTDHAAHCVLHVGGTAADAGAIRDTLRGSTGGVFELWWDQTLANALLRLADYRVGAILLNLGAPQMIGVEGMIQLRLAAPAVPILVLGHDENEDTEREIVAAGAHEYLVVRHLDSYWLSHAILHAIVCAASVETRLSGREDTRVTLDSIGDALISTDVCGRIAYLNRLAEVMTGWSRAEATGQPVDDVVQLIEGDTREPAVFPARTPAAPAASQLVSTHVLLRRDGSESTIERLATPALDRFGVTIGTTLVLRDVSASRAISARMSYLASHDVMTGLPNRLLLGDRLTRALSLAHRHSRRLAVLFVDLDRFKHINDSLGHLLGDELLRSVGRTLAMCVRSSDTVSRQGGDEFVVVLTELEHVEQAARGAQTIMSALTQPHRLGSLELHLTVSIGISVYPDDGADAETLLTRADMALYHAKDEGRDCYRFFESHLNERAVERQSIEASLHRALAQQEFELVFQPKILLNTNAIAGVEALIRWRHPERGLISPGQFVGIAEDCGLIKAIGFWVLQEACTQARAWQDAGFADISVAVNISAIEFRNEAFLPYLAGVLSQTGLDPGHLEIELTESVLMAHVDHANSVLHALKALGVRLAIDDFGTGWSSLSYLRTFPIDALKIDRSFVQAMALDSDASSIIRAVISMGKSLRHRVIAEGVETAAQLAFLLGEGCDEAQGYYLSPPVSAAECTAMLTRGDLPHLPTQHVASATLPAVARVDDGRLHVNSNIA